MSHDQPVTTANWDAAATAYINGMQAAFTRGLSYGYHRYGSCVAKKLGFILTLLLSLYSDFALTFAANANCYNK